MTSQDGHYISIKQAALSIQKFNATGIPHHLGLLKNHKSNIEKCLALGDWDKVKKEEINATRVVRQLKNLMLEMDVLRGRVAEHDLDQFDELTLPGRQKAKEAIKEYLDLQLKTPSSYSMTSCSNDENYSGEKVAVITDLPQIQAQLESTDHLLQSRQACLEEFENLQREIEDIHDIFHKLNGDVVEQAESISQIDENVSAAQVDVHEAEKSLRQALTYKQAMYPLCGAVLGFCIAGPVGLVTMGIKAGSIAAVGCGILGATGAAAIKNKENEASVREAMAIESSKED